MIVYLWETSGPACHGSGVTDNEPRALEAAEACIRSGQADEARVEIAHAVLGITTLTSGYRRTGHGWRAQRRDDEITWEPFAEQAAS